MWAKQKILTVLVLLTTLSGCGQTVAHVVPAEFRVPRGEVLLVSLLDESISGKSVGFSMFDSQSYITPILGTSFNQEALQAAESALFTGGIRTTTLNVTPHKLFPAYFKRKSRLDSAAEGLGYEKTAELLAPELQLWKKQYNPEMFVVILPAGASACGNTSACINVADTGVGVYKRRGHFIKDIEVYVSPKIVFIDGTSLEAVASDSSIQFQKLNGIEWKESFAQFKSEEQELILVTAKRMIDRITKQLIAGMLSRSPALE